MACVWEDEGLDIDEEILGATSKTVVQSKELPRLAQAHCAAPKEPPYAASPPGTAAREEQESAIAESNGLELMTDDPSTCEAWPLPSEPPACGAQAPAQEWEAYGLWSQQATPALAAPTHVLQESPTEHRVAGKVSEQRSLRAAPERGHQSPRRSRCGDSALSDHSHLQNHAQGLARGLDLGLPGRAMRARLLSPEEEEEELMAKCRSQGPPGPAGTILALPGLQGYIGAQRDVFRPDLLASVAWLAALRDLQLPFDAFHLGLNAKSGGQDSALRRNNIAAVQSSPWPPRKWHLLVLVRKVELLAGELHAKVYDPTGEAGATVDARVAQAHPAVAAEGSVLLLEEAVAIPCKEVPGRPRVKTPHILVTPRSLRRAFIPADYSQEEAFALLATAKACLAPMTTCPR